jgi:hypothetical protein
MITFLAMALISTCPKPMTDKAMFYYICLQEGGGKVRPNAFNKKENAIGPAQIRPCYLQDANEWLIRHKQRPYAHKEMYDWRKAYVVVKAYWARYKLISLEQRARAHCGGPDGPRQDCTLPYWKELWERIPESRK